MSEIPVNRLLAALLRKGFVRRDTHHIMLWFAPGGKRTSTVTRISHGERSANGWLLARIAHELHVSRAELLAFIPVHHRRRRVPSVK